MRKSENSLFPIISNREDFYKMFIIETSFSFGFKSTELDIGQGKKKKKKKSLIVLSIPGHRISIGCLLKTVL